MTSVDSWKHDIGNWQQRKQQQQQQGGVGGAAGGFLAPLTSHQNAGEAKAPNGFLSQRYARRHTAGHVTFGPEVGVLPIKGKGPIGSGGGVAGGNVTPPPLGGDDVSLSALSDAPSAVGYEATRLQDLTQSMLTEQVSEASNQWVTVFGVPPQLVMALRDALEAKCGPTVTHYWPATSSTCNWIYVQFRDAFDAARAVSMSPVTLSVTGKHPVTVGVEWTRDVNLIRVLEAQQNHSSSQKRAAGAAAAENPDLTLLNESLSRSSRNIRGSLRELVTAHVAEQVEKHDTKNAARYAMRPLPPPQERYTLSIIDAVLGTSGVSWFSRLVNRQESAQARLERLIALHNKKHDAVFSGALADKGSVAQRLPIIFVMHTQPAWRVWSNLSAVLCALCVLLWWLRGDATL